MTLNATPNFISNAGRTNAELKVCLEDIVSIIKEMPGGGGAKIATALVADAFAVQNGANTYVVGSQVAANPDNLKNITASVDMEDGREIEIWIKANNEPLTGYHLAGSDGQIAFKAAANVFMRDVRQPLRLRLVRAGVNYSWEEISRDETLRVEQMPGGKLCSVATITAGDVVVPSGALHKLAVNSSTTDVLNLITMTNANNDIQVLTLVPNNAAHTITLTHAFGGGGGIQDSMVLAGGVDVVLTGTKAITLRRAPGAPGQWIEIWRTGYSVSGPAVSVVGNMLAFSNTTGSGAADSGRLAADMIEGPGTAIVANYPMMWDTTNRKAKQIAGTPSTGDTPAWTGTTTQWTTPAAGTVYQSTQRTITASALDTLPHLLGAKPKFLQYILVCQTAEGGYAVNDEVAYSGNNLGVYIDATNIYVRYPTGTTINITHKTTGGSVFINYANWKLIVLARL